MQKKIFISYRRNDTQYQVDELYATLIKHVRKSCVFKDVESIGVGQDFEKAIDEAVGRCTVCLVAIGPNWLSEENKARLFSGNDYVRREIEAALRREEVTVIPVLFDSVMPAADQLPETIRDLHYRNAYEITRKYKEEDIKSLMKQLGIARRGGFMAHRMSGKSWLARTLTVAMWFFILMIVLAFLVPFIARVREEKSYLSYADVSAQDTAWHWHNLMDSLDGVPKIEAAVNYDRYDAICLYWNWQYAEFDYTKNTYADSAFRRLEYWKDNPWFTDLDAAVEWPSRNALYFFKGNEYVEWNTVTDQMVEGYPKSIAANWFGVWEDGISSAFYYAANKSIYFIKGNEYLIYNTETLKVEPGYPRKIEYDWPGMWTEWITAAVTIRNTSKVVFFRGYHSLTYDMETKTMVDSSLISDLNQFKLL